ncbi:hypothetical protein F4604DRAFT_1676734 [Suillus subluteus]|nr:hypothetical protein F4604DRAFT_1676734 [Suillus subluteus]
MVHFRTKDIYHLSGPQDQCQRVQILTWVNPPKYVTHSEGQSWTALHDPWVTSSPPEVADPHLGQTPQVLFPYDTFGFGIYEPRAQEFLPQHITYSEEQKSVLRELWGSPSEVADPHLGQHPQWLLPDPNSGLTSYELEAQDFLSQYVIYSEGQTWPALRNPWVTETLPEEADSYLCQPPQDLLPYGTESTDHVPGAHGILPLHSSSAEEQTWPGSSSRHDQSPPPPMPGCRRFLKKENLTRHINEVHKRKIKARCDHCGREFTRPYLKKEHILTILSEGWKGRIPRIPVFLSTRPLECADYLEPMLPVSLSRQ